MDKFESSPATGVSVVIPCYQQGHFLSEAIESVLTQTLPAHEIIVIDDGSTDGTREVALRYPGVRYVHQVNSGSAVARNKGIAESTGSYLVFLDADDRLLKDALEVGVNDLNRHPESAFVFGRCQHIEHDGTPASVFQHVYDETDDYLAMLRGNPIWHPAAVMCRRSILEAIKGFDTSLIACSDYELYLRVTRNWPVHGHNQVISEYRQHGANKTSNTSLTINSVTRILRSQRPLFKGNKQYEQTCRNAIRYVRGSYCDKAVDQLVSSLRTGAHRQYFWGNVALILRIGPGKFARSVFRRSRYGLGRMRRRFWAEQR
jgi:hypothetical protein